VATRFCIYGSLYKHGGDSLGSLAWWETGVPPGSQYGGSASSAPAAELPVSDATSYMTDQLRW